MSYRHSSWWPTSLNLSNFGYLDKLNIKFLTSVWWEVQFIAFTEIPLSLSLQRTDDKTTSSARHILSIDFDICIILFEHIIFCFDVWFVCVCVCVWERERERLTCFCPGKWIFDFVFFILSEDLCFSILIWDFVSISVLMPPRVVRWLVLLWFDFIYSLPRNLCMWPPPFISSEHWDKKFPLIKFWLIFYCQSY